MVQLKRMVLIEPANTDDLTVSSSNETSDPLRLSMPISLRVVHTRNMPSQTVAMAVLCCIGVHEALSLGGQPDEPRDGSFTN